jgi:hypothetical protein
MTSPLNYPTVSADGQSWLHFSAASGAEHLPALPNNSTLWAVYAKFIVVTWKSKKKQEKIISQYLKTIII